MPNDTFFPQNTDENKQNAAPLDNMPEPDVIRTPETAWITDDLIAYTQRVWSPRYRRPISRVEAFEILVNVARLGEVLMDIRRRSSCTTL